MKKLLLIASIVFIVLATGFIVDAVAVPVHGPTPVSPPIPIPIPSPAPPPGGTGGIGGIGGTGGAHPPPPPGGNGGTAVPIGSRRASLGS